MVPRTTRAQGADQRAGEPCQRPCTGPGPEHLWGIPEAASCCGVALFPQVGQACPSMTGKGWIF